MDDREYFQRLFQTLKPKLTFPKDRRAFNAWQVYEPSFFSQILDSEKDRQTYAEALLLQPSRKPNDPNPKRESSEVLPLKTIVLQHLLLEYKGGPFNEQVVLADKVWIGERLNVEMPIKDIVDLNNNVFWKRVAKSKCKNKVLLEECRRDYSFDWKNLAIESKLTEIFERTSREDWNEEKMAAICKAVRPYVFRLDIRQLVGMKILETNPYNPLYKIFKYPPKDCHHGNLGAALAYLENLESLTLQFGIEKVKYEYHQRHFDVSYKDIDNLASGLSGLKNFKELTIKNSRLDDRKCKTLITGILNCPLKILNLTSCNLESRSGMIIGYYLVHSPGTLKELELQDNNITGNGLQAIGYGIQEFKGELEYIGLAGNPILEAGLIEIGSGICGREQIKRMNFSRCTIDGEGILRIIQIISFHERLEWINLSAIHFGIAVGDQFILAVNAHFNLEHIEVRGCGLTENQLRKLKMIQQRNMFYKANPCMKKQFFTEADVEEIEKWIVKKKHPLLMNVFNRSDSTETFDQFDVRKPINIENVSSCIPKNKRTVLSTSAILKTNYIDCFGADFDNRPFDIKADQQPELDFNEIDSAGFDPNKYDDEEFIAAVLTGCNVDLITKLYFNK